MKLYFANSEVTLIFMLGLGMVINYFLISVNLIYIYIYIYIYTRSIYLVLLSQCQHETFIEATQISAVLAL